MKVEICSFSGYKIYPSRGKLYVRGDSKVRSLEGGQRGKGRVSLGERKSQEPSVWGDRVKEDDFSRPGSSWADFATLRSN